MRLFGSERIANVMDRMGAEEGEVITHGLVTKSIERAQKPLEMNNFAARKRLLDYDDVMNQQREVIYDMRLFALAGGEDLKGEIWEMIEGTAQAALDEYVPAGESPDKWDLAGLRRRILLDQFVVVTELPKTKRPGPRVRAPRDRDLGRRRPPERVPPEAGEPGPGRRARVELHHAQRHRRQVEGPPLRPGPPEGQHLVPRVGAEGLPGGVQAGSLGDVRGAHGGVAEECGAVLLPGPDRVAPAPAQGAAAAHVVGAGRCAGGTVGGGGADAAVAAAGADSAGRAGGG